MVRLGAINLSNSWKKAKSGHITKRGNKWIRRIMVQCAMVTIKARNSQIRQFYLRIRGRRGHKIAIVATARKLLTIIWHLLLTGEEYIDKYYVKKTIKKSRKKTGRIHPVSYTHLTLPTICSV